MSEKDGKYIFGVVKVGDKGQMVIPKEARKVYDIKSGDALLLVGDKNGMALIKTEIFQSAIDDIMGGITK
jgi:AbrB family looped-hinge helix DNA binding protein